MDHVARKRWGQHFLSDTRIIERIVAAIAPGSADHVVEIGPGKGALTRPLLERVARAYGQRVTALLRPTRRPSEARQVGVYLARRVAGLDLKAIGARFGMSAAGVSRRVGLVAKRLSEDARLRAKLVRLQSGT